MIVHYIENDINLQMEFNTYGEYEKWRNKKRSKVKVKHIESILDRVELNNGILKFKDMYNNMRLNLLDINNYSTVDYMERVKKLAILVYFVEYMDSILGTGKQSVLNNKYIKMFIQLIMLYGDRVIYELIEFIYNNSQRTLNLNKFTIRDSIKAFILQYNI